MLATSRVILTPLRPADSEILFQWINARDEVILNAPYRVVHWAAHEGWFADIQRRSDLVLFAIRDRESNELIGSCQLHTIQSVHRSAELQIRIGDTAARGRGRGTDALRLLLRFGFGDLNLHRIYLHVFASNTRARHVYEKLGFRVDGQLRDAAFVDGRYVDIVVMSMLQTDHADA